MNAVQADTTQLNHCKATIQKDGPESMEQMEKMLRSKFAASVDGVEYDQSVGQANEVKKIIATQQAIHKVRLLQMM